MREARLNPVAVANAAPQKHVRAIDTGDGYAVIGIALEPVTSISSDEGEANFCAVLTVVGGKQSELMPMTPVKLILGEVGQIPVAKLRAMFAKALEGEPEVAQ